MNATNDYVPLQDTGFCADEDDSWIDDAVVREDNTPYFASTSSDCSLFVGKTFPTKEELVSALCAWVISRNTTFKVIESSNSKYSVVCKQAPACNWRLRACLSKRSHCWKISKFDSQHTCINTSLQMDHRNLTSKCICAMIFPKFMTDIGMTPKDIILFVKGKTNVDISYYRAWDARRKALTKIFGDWESTYNSLPTLQHILRTSNPRTVTSLAVEETDVGNVYKFRRIFWSFGPCIAGFRYCRPVMCVDGTHLYGKYRGTLLIATGVDPNNGIFPLAYCIVESENTASWTWFFRQIAAIPELIRENLCIISDKHKGIINAIGEVFPPHIYRHRFCLRHLRQNFDRKFKIPSLHDLMYKAGCTTDRASFITCMNEIGNIALGARHWLERRDFSKWTMLEDNGFRYGIMTTNMSESYNGVLKGARGLPVQALIAKTFFKSVAYFVKRKDASRALHGNLTNHFETILRDREEKARYCRSTRYNDKEFLIQDYNMKQFNVTLNDEGVQSTCTCGVFQAEHFPCEHAISAMSSMNLSHYNYVSAYYSAENYRKAYEPDFHPMPDHRYWPDIAERYHLDSNTILPPDKIIKPGRPKTRRRRMTMDVNPNATRNKCSVCSKTGHNRARCPLQNRGRR